MAAPGATPAQPPGTTAAAPATTEGAFPFARVEPSMSLVGFDQIAQRPGPAQAPPPAQLMAQPVAARPVMAAPAPVATQPTQAAMPAPVAIDRSNLNAISQRMMQERVDPNKAREDARNMALLQAGLAIAGGTSPHFAQNLAGAIPALQGYQTQMASIRREGRDELKAQFDLAKADVEAQYQQGTLTYHERSIAMDRINNQERNATTLQAHRESAGASIAAARIAAEGRGGHSDLNHLAASITQDNPGMPYSAAMERAAGVLRGIPDRAEAREERTRQAAFEYANKLDNRSSIDMALRANNQPLTDANRMAYVLRMMRAPEGPSPLVPGENGVLRYVPRSQ